MRAFWLALPLLIVIGLDGLLTLRGQPPAYRQGNPAAVREACPVGRKMLARGPRDFAVALGVWAAAALVLARILPGLLGQAFYGSVLLGHAWGSASWIPQEARRGLRALGSPLAQAPDLPYAATLAYLVGLCFVTVLCLRYAGILPSGGPKPRKESPDA